MNRIQLPVCVIGLTVLFLSNQARPEQPSYLSAFEGERSNSASLVDDNVVGQFVSHLEYDGCQQSDFAQKDCCQYDSDCQSCYCGPVWTARFDAVAAMYTRTDGTKVGTNNGEAVDIEFGFAPRVTVGRQDCDGSGIRCRWFDFETTQMTRTGRPRESLVVDTYYIDLELHGVVSYTNQWEIEWSAGFRYNEFTETMNDDADLRQNALWGVGPIVGIEARRCCHVGAFFANARTGILYGDKTRTNDGDDGTFDGATYPLLEVGMGYELQRLTDSQSLWFFRLGTEYQVWQNFSSGFQGQAGGLNSQNENVWAEHSDVGFVMLSLSVGFVR